MPRPRGESEWEGLAIARAARYEWVEWIRPVPWSWFVTLTLRDPIGPDVATAGAVAWCEETRRSLRWQGAADPAWFLSREQTALADRPHFHALMSGAEDHTRYATHGKRWFARWGYCRIERVRAADAAAHYATKSGVLVYVAKDDRFAFDVSVNLPRALGAVPPAPELSLQSCQN